MRLFLHVWFRFDGRETLNYDICMRSDYVGAINADYGVLDDII